MFDSFAGDRHHARYLISSLVRQDKPTADLELTAELLADCISPRRWP